MLIVSHLACLENMIETMKSVHIFLVQYCQAIQGWKTLFNSVYMIHYDTAKPSIKYEIIQCLTLNTPHDL